MQNNHPLRWFYALLIISFLFSSCTDGKGFGGGRGGGGFGGGRGSGGFKGGSSGAGRNVNTGSFNRPRSGSSFQRNAMSFGAGALGGVAAYSLMRSMSPSYRSGYYEPGYGGGETCTNNEDLNGTRFGQFRCPLNGFPYEAKYCCGGYGKQYCCTRDTIPVRRHSYWNFLWVLIGLCVLCAVIIYFIKRRRQNEKDFYGVPADQIAAEQQEPAFYQPPPPPMGYPPPPMGYPPPPMGYPPPPMGYPPPPMGYQPSPMGYPPPQAGNPYAVPPQNYEGNFNPYSQQQQQMPYPAQPQMPYPTQQQSYNPYQVKEVGPPGYNDAIRYNQGGNATKPI